MALRHLKVSTLTPCTENWESMRGSARARHCEVCAKAVHNLSGMTSTEVEQLAIQAAMGQSVCARVTRRVSDDSLITLSAPETRSFARAGMLLSAAMICGVTAAAQEVDTRTATAVLTGRLMPATAPPNEVVSAFARSLSLRDSAGRQIPATVEADGSFKVAVPPGVYDIMARNNFWHGETVRTAVLHEGVQSMGDLQAGQLAAGSEEYETVGSMSVTISKTYWFRHPIVYARYVGRRIRMKFSQ